MGKHWVLIVIVALITSAIANIRLDSGRTIDARNIRKLSPTAYLPYISKQGKAIIYASQNLAGHSVEAECNPGGVSQCPCSSQDVSITALENYGEVTSNVRGTNTYVNAIGYKKFTETFPDGNVLTLGTYRYTGQFSLPGLPLPDLAQLENPQAVHLMIQFWDGRDALFPSNKATLEGTIFWELNPWTVDYGKIKVYTAPLNLIDTGLVVTPDTNWHSFELVIDLVNQKYVSVTVDGNTADLNNILLARVPHPEWGDDISFNITTESLASWPGDGCPHVFKWTTRFRNLALSEDSSSPFKD